jgi:hypothetical protein
MDFYRTCACGNSFKLNMLCSLVVGSRDWISTTGLLLSARRPQLLEEQTFDHPHNYRNEINQIWFESPLFLGWKKIPSPQLCLPWKLKGPHIFFRGFRRVRTGAVNNGRLLFSHHFPSDTRENGRCGDKMIAREKKRKNVRAEKQFHVGSFLFMKETEYLM